MNILMKLSALRNFFRERKRKKYSMECYGRVILGDPLDSLIHSIHGNIVVINMNIFMLEEGIEKLKEGAIARSRSSLKDLRASLDKLEKYVDFTGYMDKHTGYKWYNPTRRN